MEKLVPVGPWLDGFVWCPQNKIASVRAAYDNIRRGDLSPGVLDEVFARGGTLVEDVFGDNFYCEDCMFD